MKTANVAMSTGLGLAGSAGFLAYAVRGRSSNVFAPSVFRGVRTRPSVALTFDDGPSESTPALLELLNRYGVPATFFQCGANVRRLPSIACAVVAAGHEVGNHSDTHPRLSLKPRSLIESELTRAQAAIADITGISPRLFRAPYGVRWFGLREVQRRLGLLGVMWTTIGVDWKLPEERVLRVLQQGLQNGAIYCLHDGRALQLDPDTRVTLAAVRRFVPMLLDRGYRFETVSEILCPTRK